MLTLPRLFASPDAAYRSRREFLARAGGGFGTARARRSASGRGAESARSPLAPREPHFAAKAKRVIWLFMNGGPSPGRYLGPQARTGEARRPGTQGVRPEHRLLQRPGRPADEVAVQVGEARPVREDGERTLPEHGQARGQDGLHPLALDRLEQPLAGAVQDEHRHDPHGLPVRGKLGHLRPGQRESQSLPAFCVMYDTLGRGMPKGHCPQLGRGVPADRLPGDGVQAAGRADREPHAARRTSAADRQREQLDLLAKLNKKQHEEASRTSRT